MKKTKERCRIVEGKYIDYKQGEMKQEVKITGWEVPVDKNDSLPNKDARGRVGCLADKFYRLVMRSWK